MSRIRPPRLTYIELSLVTLLLFGSLHSLYAILRGSHSGAALGTVAPLPNSSEQVLASAEENGPTARAAAMNAKSHETLTLKNSDDSQPLNFSTRARFIQFHAKPSAFTPGLITQAQIKLLSREAFQRTPAATSASKFSGQSLEVSVETLIDPLTHSLSTEFIELPTGESNLAVELKLSNGRLVHQIIKVMKR